jgi:predicted phosphodiesterase
MQDAEADIMCFGHTHKPYHRVLEIQEGQNKRYKHAINIGSVGKPKDGDPRGGYVILHIEENTNMLDKESIKVEFIRFNYDIEQAANAVEESPLPNAYAESLRKGV